MSDFRSNTKEKRNDKPVATATLHKVGHFSTASPVPPPLHYVRTDTHGVPPAHGRFNVGIVSLLLSLFLAG